MADELARKYSPLATTPGAAQAVASLGEDSGRCGPDNGLRERTSASGDDSRDTRPDRATRFVETTSGTLSYAELAPLLAERVAAEFTLEAAEYCDVKPLVDFWRYRLAHAGTPEAWAFSPLLQFRKSQTNTQPDETRPR